MVEVVASSVVILLGHGRHLVAAAAAAVVVVVDFGGRGSGSGRGRGSDGGTRVVATVAAPQGPSGGGSRSCCRTDYTLNCSLSSTMNYTLSVNPRISYGREGLCWLASAAT